MGAHARPSLFRIRLARFLQVVLPITGISLLTYAFTHPDAEPLIPNRLPPQLQYMAAQQTPNEEVVTNWSGTHDAKPKWVWRQCGKCGGGVRFREGGRRGHGMCQWEGQRVCVTRRQQRCSVGQGSEGKSGVCPAAGG